MACTQPPWQHIRLWVRLYTTNRLTYLLSANLLWHYIKRAYRKLETGDLLSYLHLFTHHDHVNRVQRKTGATLPFVYHVAWMLWSESLNLIQRATLNYNCWGVVSGSGSHAHCACLSDEHRKTLHYICLFKPFPLKSVTRASPLHIDEE